MAKKAKKAKGAKGTYRQGFSRGMETNRASHDDNRQMNGITPLPQFGMIRARGEDTLKFLQGQLTQDVELMGLHEARLAAWCSAKGRMLASFVVIKSSAQEIWLICSADLLASTLKRLSMFVMRAKCKLDDASTEFSLQGLIGSAALGMQNAPLSIANNDHMKLTLVKNSENTLVFFHSGLATGLAATARALCIRPMRAASPMPALAAPDTLTPAHWDWLAVSSGVATVSAAISDAFVPQMLNYESVGGVNFKKGCYPGQEVVARSQFRGTLKRRAFVVHCDAPMQAGQEVFISTEADQPCGLVAQAAAHPEGGFSAIVGMQLSALEAVASGASLRLAASDGAVLRLGELPYALLDDI
jgi:tRNA-modifying protein YgfZ